MAKTLEEYVAEANQAYDPTRNSIQNQIDSIDGRRTTADEQINRNYAQQQAKLRNQRNAAAESASMQAAATGGSFGGQANLANRRYYEQTFVPAVTQLRTGQANELAQSRQYFDDLRRDYEGQLADINSRANQQALAQYYADQQLEKQLAEQRRSAAAQENYYKYLMDADRTAREAQNTYKVWDFGNGYTLTHGDNGEAIYKYNNTPISAGRFLEGTGANGARWDLWNDVWNNGISTKGVGSDTVNVYDGRIPTNGWLDYNQYLYY